MRTPEFFWLRHSPSLMSRLRRIGLWPFSACWGAAASVHRMLGGALALRTARPPCAVVSVGSVVVGGSGKTPLAAAVAQALHARGLRVALATRGFGGRPERAVTIVSNGTGMPGGGSGAVSPATVGDEAMVLATTTRGIPVLVARDRRRAGLHAVSKFGCDVLVLDDGFQHHRLRRDFDLLCFDGELGLGNGSVLPAGPLREFPRTCARADSVVLVDGEWSGPAGRQVAAASRGCAQFGARRRALRLRDLESGRVFDLSELRDREVGLLSGLADPRAFRRSVEDQRARVVVERTFPDHHAYVARDLRRLDRSIALWVTTGKDAVKLNPTWRLRAPIWVLEIDLEIADEGALIDRIVTRIQRSPS